MQKHGFWNSPKSLRLKEHKAHGRRGECDKSAIIKHSTDSDHVIDWQSAEIIAPEKHWYTRRIREAIEIHKHDTVPQDIGYFISSIWHPILPSINTHTQQSTDTPQRTGNSHTAGIPHTHTMPRWQPIKKHHTTVVASDTLHRAPIRTLPIQHIIPADAT